ncbi:M24 family metallopeptidase [Candidatus Halobonum tyrrellensis]|uniref:Xaa-pro aminopeptidase n=1 Tax=Candidatus Halobonum tyrrellensis G22 TaxID=1324957 RepID=V4HCV0_9EURY|nr:Xaa-Pro peptidase family protein [Candidatus Halobonum tyrrellensis]ESP87873.1 xaa-pro aminopeptidase [Candidatus Halobonum tyrrellensis G22]
MNDTAYERRTREGQRLLADRDADCLVLFPGPNLRYLSGFDERPGERHLLLFVPAAPGGREAGDGAVDGGGTTPDPTFLVPDLYAEQVRAESWVSDVRTWADGDDPVAAVESVVADLDLPPEPRLLVDDTMHARFTLDLRRALPDATLGLASEAVSELRVRKDDAELDALRRAGEAADAALADLRELGAEAVGTTESALADYVEERLAAHGGDSVSFDTIVGSGPNGAMPHHTHGDREIRSGEPVVLDFGTRVDGYVSDQTRTLVFDGDPSAEVREVHALVREAQEAAVGAVEPGVTAAEVDAAARRIVEAGGYGDEFVHRTGHGVGLDVHEEPYVVAGNDRELEAGMVFSVEPGVYLPGEFGVRVEDLVAVTADGCERVNHTDRGWRC